MSYEILTIIFVIISVASGQLYDGDPCIPIRNGTEANGVCTPVQNCRSVLANIISQKYNHVVCGFEGFTQIVCCPALLLLNITNSLECDVVNSTKTGIIKFLSECPELNYNNAGQHINKLCAHEICSDLVCCPVRPTNKLKDVCWNVDHAYQMLQIRLSQNLECTVKELNLTGRYQKTCAYAERNPVLKSLLQNICNDKICDGWYCCPIEEGDTFECTSGMYKMVGPSCIDSKSGRNGTCQTSCAHHDIMSLDYCGSYCCSNYFCCSNELSHASQTISARECNLHARNFHKVELVLSKSFHPKNCTAKMVLAAGGQVVLPGEFPHMVALGYKSMEDILWNCGGSLLSDRYVLTAGHCLTTRNFGPVQKVRLGVIDLQISIYTLDCPEDFDVANLIPHPEYQPKYFYNDIGLIELVAQVNFNFHIRPICLPSSPDILGEFISMGWGETGITLEPSTKLLKVNQELFSYEECQNQYDVGRKYPNGIINDTHICAGSRNSIQSTCPGDSGGPLIVQDPTDEKLFYIYGIVSFGTFCEIPNSAGVYTKVFPFIKWIEDTVWKTK